MDVSVIIPTRNRPEKLAKCVKGLSEQDFDANHFEVLVGIDGPDQGESAEAAAAASGRIDVRVTPFDHAGPAATRNRLINSARGRTLLILNDDVRVAPDLVRVHHQEQEQLRALGGPPDMILGSGDWVVHEPDRLFDRLLRETSMLFFYDQMTDSNPDRDWGFRHAWTLNLSAPTDAVRAIGGFNERLPYPCYEDLEFGWRLSTELGSRVLYRPRARVWHDHRYEPEGYLEHCRMAGRAAWWLARLAPECSQAIFRRDIASQDELAYSREFLERERAVLDRLRPEFLALAEAPADSVQGPEAPRLIRLAYQQHIPLQRAHWRQGLLEEARRVERVEAPAARVA